MDDRRFDDLARRLGGGRRRFLAQVIGLSGAAVVGGLATQDAEAARRGYSGPPLTSDPNVSIFFESAPGGACAPFVRASGFRPNTDYSVAWYVTVRSQTTGPYSSLLRIGANGSGVSGFAHPPIAPQPNVRVSVDFDGYGASAAMPESC